jgi:hypothetical protein
MFPGVVAGVTARGAISGGVIGPHLQLVSLHAYFFRLTQYNVDTTIRTHTYLLHMCFLSQR